MWLSVDPMREKNVGASPYNYCHGNPIMMVDPDGLSDYEVDPEGNVKCVNPKTKTHTLYSINEKGVRTGEKINVINKSILISKNFLFTFTGR